MKVFLRDAALVTFFVFFVPHIIVMLFDTVSYNPLFLMMFQIISAIISGLVYGYLKKPYKLVRAISIFLFGSLSSIIVGIGLLLAPVARIGTAGLDIQFSNIDYMSITMLVIMLFFTFLFAMLFLAVSFVTASRNGNFIRRIKHTK